jgi:hypothetical protein
MKKGEAFRFLETHTTRSEERRTERNGEHNVETNLMKGTERNEASKECRLNEVRRKCY